MPITAHWDNEDRTVIRIHLDDPWNMDEYTKATASAWSLIDSVTYTVHLIIDFTDAATFPKNMLSGAMRTNSHIHPRQGLVVGVKISPYLRAVMRVAVRVFPRLGQNLFFTQTLKEAYDLIQKQSSKPSS
jgi:hypothetical protein